MKSSFLLLIIIFAFNGCHEKSRPIQSRPKISIAQPIGDTHAPENFDFKTSHSVSFSISPQLHGIRGEQIFFKLTLDPEGQKTLFLGRINDGQIRRVPVVIPTYIQSLYLEVYNEKGEKYEGTLQLD